VNVSEIDGCFRMNSKIGLSLDWYRYGSKILAASSTTAGLTIVSSPLRPVDDSIKFSSLCHVQGTRESWSSEGDSNNSCFDGWNVLTRFDFVSFLGQTTAPLTFLLSLE